MEPYKTETDSAIGDAAPLFASVWLALFNELRKSYAAQRAVTLSGKQNSHARGQE
jgi:hypothetical protein